MKNKSKKLLSTLLAVMMVFGLFAAMPITANAAAVSIITPTGKAPDAGDTVYYGKYPQSEYTPKSVPDAPAEGITYTDADGTEFVYVASPCNSQGHYYAIEPIAWRVLSNSGGELFLVSEKTLDGGVPYHEDYETVTWAESTVRSWLNGYGATANNGGSSGTDYSASGANFISRAFSAEEQAAIITTSVVNDDNGDISGGDDTDDKIFLLSIQEVSDTGGYFANNTARLAFNTAYTASKHKFMEAAGMADWWWLRSPGSLATVTSTAYVNRDGSVISKGWGVVVASVIRPALNLNLASVSFTSDAPSMSNFTKVNTYTRDQFTDVNETLWYGHDQQKVIATAYEYGLMQGSGNTFNPTGNMTIAEAVTIAARVHHIHNGGDGIFTQGNPWYQVYVDYCIANDIIGSGTFSDYNKAATRAEMAYIFSCALPASEFASQNTVDSLPDVNSNTPYYSAILMLYKAGVVAGSDSIGTFNPANNITRAEAAAIISRVILPTARFSGKTFG